MKKIIAERLLEERERLGFKKGEMASAGGVANSTYTNYEEGNRAPDGEFLAAIATAGADVNYILTGKRTEKTQAERLNEKMVQLFEGLDAEQQREILGVVQEKKRLNQCLSELDELKRKQG